MGLHEIVTSGLERMAFLPGLRQLQQIRYIREFVANRDRNMFLGVYDTWEKAETAASSYGQAGYDNTDSANLYLTRLRIDRHDYPALHWLYRSMNEGMRTVFDVGGSTGIKYLAFRDHLASWPDMRWTVQDVPAMVARGRELASKDESLGNLAFTDRFADASGIDVLYASGVLQYLPSTLGDLLAGVDGLPRRIVINTAAIHPASDFFTVNSIGTAFCPYRVQTQATLIRSLTRLGYKLRETWVNPDKLLTIPGDRDHSLREYSGYVLDLRAQSA